MGCGSSAAYKASKKAADEPATNAEPASDAFVTLFGQTLQGKQGEVSTATALAGSNAVAIYFSAHWCPPCRGFTPSLANAYKNALKAKGLEVVFVSSDRSESDFSKYYKEMPWLALPFGRRDVKETLSKKFKVQGIPTLVILDAEGQIITTDGRSKVASDPQGANFPWKPRSFQEIIGEKFCKGDETVGKEAISGKKLGLYFSAHWCPPCRGFTPKLAEHYKAYKVGGLPFEVIFITGDRSEKDFNDYYKEMQSTGGDWLALPWASKTQREELNSLFDVSGIPCLVIVDENGKVINKNARGAVSNDPSGVAFPWMPPLVGSLEAPEGIDETPSLCVFMEMATPEQQKDLISQMERVAEKYVASVKAKGEEPEFKFFCARTSEGPVSHIRTLCEIPSDDAKLPQMLLLDINDNGGFYKSEDNEITETSIEALIKSYQSKTCERQQMKAHSE
jgi:nucleoredoxin